MEVSRTAVALMIRSVALSAQCGGQQRLLVRQQALPVVYYMALLKLQSQVHFTKAMLKNVYRKRDMRLSAGSNWSVIVKKYLQVFAESSEFR